MELIHHLLFLLILMNTIFNIHSDNTNPDVFLTACGTNKTDNIISFYTDFVNTTNLVYQNMTTLGFGAGVTGSIYILGQCFNYISSIDCKLCYAKCISVGTPCLPATDSRIYLDGCFLRYSNYDFLDMAVDALDSSQCSNSTEAALNSPVFKDSVVGLMNNLTLGAEKDNRYYSAGSMVALSGVTIYGMAQCWRSLNVTGCRDCLARGRENVTRCLPSSDGKALNAGCIVRYSTSPFYLEGTATSSGLSGRRGLGAMLGAILGAVLVTVIAIFWIRRRVQNKSRKASDEDISEEIIRSIAASNLIFRYDNLKDATDSFSEINKLGQGGFGAVYKGVLADGNVIAVKRLVSNTRQRADQFFKEVSFVNQIQHKNLVRLLGCSIEGPESLVVYEYLCNTSLEKFLYVSNACSGYMAPEYIVHGQLTEKADVYSYGILVIEIITGRKNQNSISTSSGHSLMSMVWQHFNSETLIDLVDDQLQGQCSEEEVLNVIHVALLCTQASPILRPPMWKVVEMLTSRCKDLPLPTEPPFTNIKGVDTNNEGSRATDNQMSTSIMEGR